MEEIIRRLCSDSALFVEATAVLVITYATIEALVRLGEYDAAGQPPLLFVANRTVEETPAPTTVTLGAKWTTIDVFDPTNASWTSAAAATDTFTYAGAAGSGGALYRLEP